MAAAPLASTQSCRPADRQTQRLQPGTTMLVVRNIPCTFTPDDVMRIWPARGCWNYLFLPYNLAKKRSMGFLFMSFIDHQHAVEFTHKWHRCSLPGRPNRSTLSISAAALQNVGDSLACIAWEQLLQLAEVGMEPVLFVRGLRVDTRLAYLALASPSNESGGSAQASMPQVATTKEHSSGAPEPPSDGPNPPPSAPAADQVPWPLYLVSFSL
mmetsp:Transcript_9088/g.21226  ORF Transcript_9088/g.21226 Transcript_9088/m.21226 type:complete len:212 (-) Transcript_9088:65-700(-)